MTGNRQHEPRQVARAAGAREPRSALVLAEREQRVRVEERVALQRDARQHRVVDCAFVYVDVPRVLLQQEHGITVL